MISERGEDSKNPPPPSIKSVRSGCLDEEDKRERDRVSKEVLLFDSNELKKSGRKDAETLERKEHDKIGAKQAKERTRRRGLWKEHLLYRGELWVSDRHK